MVNLKDAACRMEKRTALMLKTEVIPRRWKSQKEASITQYHPDLVEDTMEEEQKIPGGLNSQREANTTYWDWPCWEDEQKEKEMIPGGWNSRKDTSDTNYDPWPV